MKKISKNIINDQILTEMDCKILMFLWKWKVATSLTLREHVASQKTFWQTYRRLNFLFAQKFIEVIAGGMKEKFMLWQLSDKGFEYMREELGMIEDAGFRPVSPYHDSIVTAFHLGHWLFAKPKEVELFTEQQIRACYIDQYPSWVPPSKSHRPDGYTLIKNANKNSVLAIEVELSQKRSDRYQVICDFYDERNRIDHVLWLVRGQTMLNAIQKSFVDRQIKRMHCHLFFDFDDFKQNAWDAKIMSGQKTGISVAEIYQQCGSNILGNMAAIRTEFDPKLTFLKPIKSPYGLGA